VNISSQFLETLTGLATIRAFKWENALIARNHSLLNESQQPAFLLPMIQQWLTVAVNCTVAVIATILVCLATKLRASSGLTSVGLISLMSFSDMLASIVRQWTQLETSLGAVSRLKSFNEIVQSEDLPGNNNVLPEGWPSRGAIDIKDVSATYV
jgi:ATP-binding cassette subfamily C (CFTR/MRP) protein 1